MSQSAIVLPAAVQALLSILLLFLLAPARARSLRKQGLTVDDRSVRLGLNDWSDEALQIAACYKNQFEAPVLFFAAVAIALALRQVDTVMVALAWAFAVARMVQIGVHITSNEVRLRATAFVAGIAALLAMWVRLAWHAALGG